MKLFIPSLLAPLGLLVLTGCGGGAPSAPPPAATADAAVTQVIDSLKKDDPSGFWHMLPASYQTESNDLVHDMAAKIPADLYNDGMGLLTKMEKVLRTKKDLLLANPMMLQAPDDVEANYDNGLKMLKIWTSSDLMTHNGLSKLDIGTFMATTGSELMKVDLDISDSISAGDVKDLMTYKDKLSSVKTELVSEEGETAVVRITADGEDPEKIDFARVEGKWIPAEMAAEWDKMVAESKKGIEGISITPEQEAQANMMIGMIDKTLDQLLEAETQADLEQALGGIMGMIMGMSMSAGSM